MPRKPQKLLLIISCDLFGCELLLPQTKAERLARNLIKGHKESLRKLIMAIPGKKTKSIKNLMINKASEHPITIEFRKMDKHIIWKEQIY
jgi:bisphosphoglycerate-dependent phosphoglycerate mutase